MKKRVMALALAAAMLFSVCSANETIKTDIDAVYLSGGYRGIPAGTEVILAVTKGTVDWLDEEVFDDGVSENMIYFAKTTLDADGKYMFKIILPESGEYNTYVSVKGKNMVEEGFIKYIDATGNETAIGALLAAAGSETDAKAILENNAADFGLYGDFFLQYDFTTAEAIARKSVKDYTAADGDLILAAIEKSVLADAFNKSSITLNEEFAEVIYGEKSEYFDNRFAQSMTAYMSGKNIEKAEDFDKLAKEALILSNVNDSDGTGRLQLVLSDYATFIGVEESKITTDLCSDIATYAETNPFANVSAIALYINSIPVPTPDLDGGGGGGGGGGATGKGDAADGMFTGTETVGTGVETVQPVSSFDDLAGVEWAEAAVNELFKLGVVNGREERKFYPNATLKREEFVKMLTQALEINLVDEIAVPFNDVGKDEWYYPYIKTAYLGNIVSGISLDRFGVGLDISRQDLCVMAVNALDATQEILPGGNMVDFSDSEKIADYAKDAVEVLSAAGVVSGDENKNFNPEGNATRAEAAKIIYNIIKLIQ